MAEQADAAADTTPDRSGWRSRGKAGPGRRDRELLCRSREKAGPGRQDTSGWRSRGKAGWGRRDMSGQRSRGKAGPGRQDRERLCRSRGKAGPGRRARSGSAGAEGRQAEEDVVDQSARLGGAAPLTE